MSSRLKDDARLRAMARFKNKRMEKSKLESERDSGFSDGGSEHLSAVDQTDTDDASSSRSQLTLQSLSPMILMNNVVLKQSGENPSSLKPWAFSPGPQVVFLQPVVPQRSGPVPKGPPSKRRRHRKYLPILKSYPKIAPHPGDARPKSSSGSSLDQKDSLPSALPASEHRPEATDGEAHSNKIKRFCNTYNILSNSGLLDITLRTKELIRQNRRTQTELDLLREHTNLFLEALRTGDLDIWSKLQTSSQEEDKEKDKTKNLQ